MGELEVFENYIPALWQQEGLVYARTRHPSTTYRRRSPAHTFVAGAMVAVTFVATSALLDFRVPSSIRVSAPELHQERAVVQLTDAVPDGYWESLSRVLKKAERLPELVADKTQTVI